MIRTWLVFSLLLASACTAAAFQDKIDGKLLVGKWEPEKAPPGLKIVLEFMKDDKLKLEIEVQDKKEKVEGTYKLEGDQLTMTMKREGQEVSQKLTVVKLNDKEAVMKDDKRNDEQTLKRIK